MNLNRIRFAVLGSTLLTAAAAHADWPQNFFGPTPDHGYGITVDSKSNVYVTGENRITGSPATSQVLLIKYNKNGKLIWYRELGSSSTGFKVATDPSASSVYVGANLSDGPGVVKYTASGEFRWRRSLPNVSALDGFVMGLVATSTGVVAAGKFRDEQSAYEGYVSSWAANGAPQWSDLPDNAYSVSGLALDPDGNVYTSSVINAVDNADMRTTKYSPTGETLWSKTFVGPTNDDENPTSLTLDSQNNVIVTAIAGSNLGIEYDILTVKYSFNGQKLWQNRTGTPNDDLPRKIVIDANDNAIVTANIGNGSTNDILTIKFAPNGAKLWTARYEGATGPNADNYVNDLAVDASGNIYVAGSEQDFTSSKYHFATIKYSPSGVRLTVHRFTPNANYNAYLNAIAYDPLTNKVFVTGDASINNDSGEPDIYTLRY